MTNKGTGKSSMENILQDIDIYGREINTGAPKEHFEQEAVKNALTLWLTSKKGEFLYQPELGGILTPSIFKLMSDNNLDLLAFKIRNAINNSFFPSIQLTSLDLNPNYEQRMLEISIQYINPVSLREEAVLIYLNAPQPEKRWSYEEIAYVGENLRNFVLLKKPENIDKKLLYNSDGVWVYGKYQLTNLTTEDAYFNEILEICNLT
jgi:hypothetical protein